MNPPIATTSMAKLIADGAPDISSTTSTPPSVMSRIASLMCFGSFEAALNAWRLRKPRPAAQRRADSSEWVTDISDDHRARAAMLGNRGGQLRLSDRNP